MKLVEFAQVPLNPLGVGYPTYSVKGSVCARSATLLKVSDRTYGAERRLIDLCMVREREKNKTTCWKTLQVENLAHGLGKLIYRVQARQKWMDRMESEGLVSEPQTTSDLCTVERERDFEQPLTRGNTCTEYTSRSSRNSKILA